MTDASLQSAGLNGEKTDAPIASKPWPAAWLNGGASTFTLFFCFGAAVLIFALMTVFQGREQQLATQPGAMRSHHTITYWEQHGFFRTGGLIHLPPASVSAQKPHEVFWRSSPGAYMISGYIVERFATMLTGRYSAVALAIHNLILMLIAASLLALLVFRLLTASGVDCAYAIIFATAVQLVALSFPDSLSQYWEIYPQELAISFALLFLIFALREHPTRSDVTVQAFSAFGLVYTEFVYGILFLAAYLLLRLLVDSRRVQWRSLFWVTIVPVAGAALAFAAQVTVNRAYFSQIPLEGSGFLSRSGLDGVASYYGEHGALLYGRDVARLNFPSNRPYLFNWRWLFVAGCVGLLILIIASLRESVARRAVLVLGTLIGAYLFYAAIFSQAVVIHPYEYDYLLAAPLIACVFGLLPGAIELWYPTKGIAATVIIFIAAWYSMVQMRNYALRYPLPTATNSATTLQASAAIPPGQEQQDAGQWVSVGYSPANFTADSGSIRLTPASQSAYRYALIGKTMLLSVNLQAITTSGSPREIRVAIPGGRVAAGVTGGAAMVDNNNAWAVSRYYTAADSSYVSILPAAAGGSFANCEHCIFIHFIAMFEVR